MKIKYLLLTITAATAVTAAAGDILPSAPINIYGGPGIAISKEANVAELPPKAFRFLQNYYKDTPVNKVKINSIKDNEEVWLADGTIIKFDKQGVVTDIRAPYGQAIPPEALIDLLPEKAVYHLIEINAAGQVNSIVNGESKGVGVILLDNVPPQMIFNHDGTFLITNG